MHERFCGAVTAFLVAARVYATTLDHGDLVTFPTRHGVTQGIFIESPSPTPPLVVVLYSGNDGVTRLDSTGATNWRNNFMIRTVHCWIDKGYAALLTDASSDRQVDGMDDYCRRSADALTDQRFIIVEVRKRFPQSKILLVSTSRGTVMVGNAPRRRRASDGND